MLVCQCNVITERDVERVILGFLEEDPWQLIVPAKVYHELGKRGRCCGCFPNVVDVIVAVTEKYHLQREANDENRLTQVHAGLEKLRERHQRQKPPGGHHERRTAGHRAA